MADIHSENTAEAAVEAARVALIARQNDRFRTTWGADFTVPGQIVMTRGVAALSHEAQVAIMVAVMQFSEFTEDNDPYGTHDFGIFTVAEGEREVRLYWKIDGVDAPSHNGIAMCQTGFVGSQ